MQTLPYSVLTRCPTRIIVVRQLTVRLYEARNKLAPALQIRDALVPIISAVALVALTLAVYYPVFSLYFAADDAAWLGIMKENNGSLLGVFQAYLGRTSIFVPSLIGLAIFGLFGVRPEPYFAAILALHVGNTLLVSSLARRLTRDEVTAFLSALFFSVAFSHYEAVTWVSGISEQTVALFFLLSCVLFVDHLGNVNSRSTLLDLPFAAYPTHPPPGPPLPSPQRGGKGRVREGLGGVKKPELNNVKVVTQEEASQ